VIREARTEFTLIKGSGYTGNQVSLQADGLGIQWGYHDVPVLTRGDVREGVILARLGSGPAVHCNGHVMAGGLLYYAPGSEFQGRTAGPVGWVSLSVGGLKELAATLAPGLELASPGGPRPAEATSGPVQALRGALRDVRRAVELGSLALADPVALRALTTDLGTAMVRVIAGLASRSRAMRLAECSALVRLAEDFVRAGYHQPMSVPDLCAAVGASEARLREAFLRIYGVGPSRYMRLRRFHLVRRRLLNTTQEASTVSAAAASLGFFEFGRFAGEYRQLFGELPSHTPRLS